MPLVDRQEGHKKPVPDARPQEPRPCLIGSPREGWRAGVLGRLLLKEEFRGRMLE